MPRSLLSLLSPAAALANGSGPRGGGTAVCDAWRDPEINREHAKPYLEACASMGSMSPEKASAEMDEICRGMFDTPPRDIEAYVGLAEYVKEHRNASTATGPFNMEYFESQADRIEQLLPAPKPARFRVLDYGCGSGETLSVFHQMRGAPAEDLHCIELYDMVPEARKNDFELHILDDPVDDLRRLAHGPLSESFDVISSFAVFHHIPDTAVRSEVWSGLFSMAKPGSFFLLADWDSEGRVKLDNWYDVAHFFLWIFLGMSPPREESRLGIGTLYAGVAQYVEMAKEFGFVDEPEFSSKSGSALGSFDQVFSRPGSGAGHSRSDGGGNVWPFQGVAMRRKGTGRKSSRGFLRLDASQDGWPEPGALPPLPTPRRHGR